MLTARNVIAALVLLCSTPAMAFHAISGRDMIQKFGYRECPR